VTDAEDNGERSVRCYEAKLASKPEDRPVVTDRAEGGVLGVRKRTVSGKSSTDNDILATLKCSAGALP
jgi:hypothetical protein